MHYIAVLHDIVLALDGYLACFATLGLGAQGDIVVVFYHLGTYKASLEVGMDNARRLRGFHPLAESPSTAFLGAGGEECL